MAFYIHISEVCEKEARKHHSLDHVRNFAEKLEQQQNIDYLDSYGKHFIVKDFGRSYRLIIRKVYEGDDCLLVFWHFYPKSATEYSDFYKNPDHFVELFDSAFSQDYLDKVLQEKRQQGGTTFEQIRELSEDEKNFLFQQLPFSTVNRDWVILESEDWLLRTLPSSTGKKSNDNALVFSPYISQLHNLVLKALEDNNENTLIASNGIGILVERFPKFKILFLIAPVRSQDHTDIYELHKKYADIFSNDVDEEKLIRRAKRSYPSVVVYDDELWIQEIQQEDEKANLALSQEEVKLLQQPLGFYPLFINGRPGSGKSTVLQYLFAEYLFNYAQQSHLAPPLYLTYSPELLDIARNLVLKLLTSNASKIILNQRITPEKAESLTRNTFFVFREYLLKLLPDRQRFAPDKYINYPRFRSLYNKSFAHHPDKRLHSMAEIAWHVIRTYIKGSVTDPDDFMEPKDFEAFPSKHKSVTLETFELVYNNVWKNWYQSLNEEQQYWDDQDLARAVLSAMWEGNLPESFEGHSVIFCDEAQDFTRNELRLIFRLSVFSKRRLYPEILNYIPFAFAGDPFQTLNPTGFDWDSTSENLYQTIRNQIDRRQNPTLEINYQELQFNYRSRKSIVQLCNFIHLLRGIAFEKKNLKPQQAWYDDPSDMPSFFEVENPIVSTNLKKQEENVIIVPCQEGEELSFVQNDPLLKEFALSQDGKSLIRNILSPMRAKGQEFDRVVLYRFGEACVRDAQYKPLLSLIDPDQPSPSLSPEEYIPLEYFINRLYVAASRARKRILIVDTKEGIEKFWKFFKDFDLDVFTEHYKQISKNSTWDPSTHLVKIQQGSREDWEKDFNDPIELAKQFMESGKQKEDPYLLERAAQNFRLAGEEDKAIECEALAYKYDREFLKAGEHFEKLGNIQEAEECFWKAKAYERVSALNSGTIRCMIAQFMQFPESFTLQETRQFLDRAIPSLLKNETPPDEVWGEVLAALYRDLLRKGHEKDPKPFEWKQYYERAKELRKFGILPASVDHEIERLYVHATPYPEKLEVLQQIGVSSAEIIEQYDRNRSTPLSSGQADIVIQALKKEEKYDDLEDLIKRFPSIERYGNLLATYIQSERFAERREPLILNLFIFLTEHGEWDVALDFTSKGTLTRLNESTNTLLKKYHWDYLLDIQFIKALSVSEKLAREEPATQIQISKYLKERLIEKASAFYTNLTVAQAGAALERAGKIMDCLEFYEMVWDKKTWPANEDEIRLAQKRWLKCKQRQIEILASTDDEKHRIQREIHKKQREWKIHDLSALPEFPEVDLSARPKPIKISASTERRIFSPSGPEKMTLIPNLTDITKEVERKMVSTEDVNINNTAVISSNLKEPPLSNELLTLPTIKIEVSYADQTFEVELVRQRGKMTIKRKGDMEMVTITAKTMKVQGSDDDFNAEIVTREQKTNSARYFIRPWNLTCILRKHDDKIFVDLYYDDKRVELFNTRLG